MKILMASLAALMAAPHASASLLVYVGKNLTRDGSTMLAGFGDEPSSHWLSIVPRKQHPPGTMIEVGGTAAARLPGELMKIPQAAETHRYLSMDYSVFAGLLAPLTNGGMNEHGVAVRDVALNARRELVEMTSKQQRGLNYSDIARIVLERARTAREGVEIASRLVTQYGDFSYGGNSHVFADPNEGWVFLTFAGSKGLWVAKRLGPDDVWLNWRGYTGFGYIQTLPENWKSNPDYMASENFVSFAVEKGWYKPGSGPFPVIQTYCRGSSMTDWVANEARKSEAAVRAAAPKVDVQLLMEIIHAAGRDSSGYGQVAHLRADIHPYLRTLWIAPGPPLTAAFVPWRIGADSVPAEYQRHRYLTAGEAERAIPVEQQGLESTEYANRAVKRLLYLVNEHRDAFLPEVSAALTAFESARISEQPDVERTARILLDANDERLAQRYLTEQARSAAAAGMSLIRDLAASIEVRTKLLFGIRVP